MSNCLNPTFDELGLALLQVDGPVDVARLARPNELMVAVLLERPHNLTVSSISQLVQQFGFDVIRDKSRGTIGEAGVDPAR